MRYVISHQDAYWFCYNAGSDRLRAYARTTSPTLEGAASKASELKKFNITSIETMLLPPRRLMDDAGLSPDDFPRHVLVPEGTGGTPAKGFVRHRWRGEVPAGSFLQVGPGIHVCSPELCLVQLAATLPAAEFLRYAMAFFACYYIGEKGRVEREPVTTVARVEAFLDACHGHRGVGRCRQLLRMARDNARSPKEIELHLLLALPAEMGGYDLGGDMLNYRVDPEGAAVDRPDRRYAEPDLAWTDQRIAVEYLGKEHDDTVPQDRRRINMLTAMRWFVLQVDRFQLSDPALLDVIARQVAQLLECSVPEPTDEWLASRGELRKLLLGKGHVRM